jgi:hypothetical protein
MSSTSVDQKGIPKFPTDPKLFLMWKQKMEYYLDALDLMEAVEKDLPNNRRSTLSFAVELDDEGKEVEPKKDADFTQEEKALIQKAKKAASIMIQSFTMKEILLTYDIPRGHAKLIWEKILKNTIEKRLFRKVNYVINCTKQHSNQPSHSLTMCLVSRSSLYN